jgi:thiamine biosynthesis lipoprotein
VIHRFQHHGLLGTDVELRLFGLKARHRGKAGEVARVVGDEIERLQAIFTAFDPSSELCRWRDGTLSRPSPEFSYLMGQVLMWWERSGGAFNPLTGRLGPLWAAAERSGRAPEDHELRRTAAGLQEPCFSMTDGVAVVDGDCRELNLNAVAKGYIVDRSLDTLEAWFEDHGLDVDAMVVNAGGDICQRGVVPSSIGIENPLRPYDNEPPLTTIELQNGAIATSGGSRRGFTVGGRRHSHLLDPRTGRPVTHTASITVVAGDAATADVVATAAAVMAPTDAVDWIDSLSGDSAGPMAAMVIRPDGARHVTAGWRDATAAGARPTPGAC